MIRLALLFIAAAVQQVGISQTIRFEPRSAYHELVLDQTEKFSTNSELTISTLKFFVGHITLCNKGHIVLQDSAYHLVDAADAGSLNILLSNRQKVTFDSISFTLGVDSMTSASGAFGGDLDPTNGMYWTWNSGYINFKMEGTSPVCNTTKNAFNFHLGGYMAPYRSAQVVGLHVASKNEVIIRLDLSEFLTEVDLAKDHTIMSPSARAVELSSILARSFHIVK